MQLPCPNCQWIEIIVNFKEYALGDYNTKDGRPYKLGDMVHKVRCTHCMFEGEVVIPVRVRMTKPGR